MLPDRSVLIGQKLVENAEIKKFKCDILSNFQTMWTYFLWCTWITTAIPAISSCVMLRFLTISFGKNFSDWFDLVRGVETNIGWRRWYWAMMKYSFTTDCDKKKLWLIKIRSKFYFWLLTTWKLSLKKIADFRMFGFDTLFENYSKCRICFFEFWHFPPIFVLLKLTCLVTLFDRKLQVFKNSQKWTIFDIIN